MLSSKEQNNANMDEIYVSRVVRWILAFSHSPSFAGVHGGTGAQESWCTGSRARRGKYSS
jgi:hypothetical protein